MGVIRPIVVLLLLLLIAAVLSSAAWAGATPKHENIQIVRIAKPNGESFQLAEVKDGVPKGNVQITEKKSDTLGWFLAFFPLKGAASAYAGNYGYATTALALEAAGFAGGIAYLDSAQERREVKDCEEFGCLGNSYTAPRDALIGAGIIFAGFISGTIVDIFGGPIAISEKNKETDRKAKEAAGDTSIETALLIDGGHLGIEFKF